MPVDVLDENDRSIEEDPEVHGTHGQQIGGHADEMEPDEGGAQREGHGHRDGERRKSLEMILVRPVGTRAPAPKRSQRVTRLGVVVAGHGFGAADGGVRQNRCD